MGTLYWFFYGTAFVIGLLEIIAGELETGVTRFIAVSVKTFVLCLGASFGMMLGLSDPGAELLGNQTTLNGTHDKWLAQAENCGPGGHDLNLDEVWWRIPLYLLCSARYMLRLCRLACACCLADLESVTVAACWASTASPSDTTGGA